MQCSPVGGVAAAAVGSSRGVRAGVPSAGVEAAGVAATEALKGSLATGGLEAGLSWPLKDMLARGMRSLALGRADAGALGWPALTPL